MKKYLFIFGLLAIGGLGFWGWNKNQFLLNPLSGKKNLGQKTWLNSEKSKKIFGFLPTWMVGKNPKVTKSFLTLSLDFLLESGFKKTSLPNLK